ncbi:MAG: S4 domain-containing protein [Akkermansiaceae bacterium]|jgi:ribosome-associated heat shock protein Hsp15|nr:S4 domain-containing protein [Akkermansiaceae bacterium]
MSPESVRTDKWLWAVRLFRSRGEAAKACEAGKVRGGERVFKASTLLKGGEEIELPWAEGPGLRKVRVLGLIDKRVGAPQARTFCEDMTSEEVLAVRAEWARNRSQRLAGEQGRPTKKKRREMEGGGGFFD